MLTLADEFVTAIERERVRIAEIYDIELQNGAIYYYTSHTSDIEWDHTYHAVPIMRGQINFQLNLEVDDVLITLAAMSGDLFGFLQNNAIDGAVVTIKRVLWDQSYADDMEEVLFMGTANIEFDRNSLNLHCKSIIDTLNLQVPSEIYQEPCNNEFCDNECTLPLVDYGYSGRVTADGPDQFTVIDTVIDTVYRVPFTDGDSTNPIEIGQTMEGGTGQGTGVVVAVTYVTESTGFIWYVAQAGLQFVDGEIIYGS